MLTDQTIILLIKAVIGIGVLIAIAVMLKRKLDGNKQAKEFLTDMVTDIKTLIMETAIDCATDISTSKFPTVGEFENYVLEKAVNTVWSFTARKLEEAKNADLIPSYVCKLITIEYVDKFVKNLVSSANLGSEIRGLYCENIVLSSAESMVEEDNKIATEFSSEDYFEDEEEVDNLEPGDLEPDDTVPDVKLVDGNKLEKIEEPAIIPPEDEVDITQDERVIEELPEGLTEEEIAQGIHYNKHGRKIDSKGRYIKTKK